MLRGLCLLLLAVTCAAPARARPTVTDTADGVTIRGRTYELRVSRLAGVFDFLVQEGSRLVSVMRPGGELGWYGYDVNGGGGASTRGVRPVVGVRRHARGVTVTARCILDQKAGLSHTAQYDCLDDCVVVCSRYEGKAPAAGLGLVRTGPKLDVDIARLDHYLFRDASGRTRSGALTGRARDFYAGVRPWEGTEAASELPAAQPYMLLHNPATGAKLAVIYPFADAMWRGRSRFLQLYRDGGNYWYTGTGTDSAVGRDYIVCLYADATPDEKALEKRMPALLSDARDAVQLKEVQAEVRRVPGPADGPLYLLSYDHAVGCPRIQDEAQKSAAFLDTDPELKIGLQAEGFTWDWLAQNDPGFVAQARGWLAKYGGRWLPGGGSYAQPYFTFISEESGIRQMFYGTRAIKEHLGYDNRIYIYSEHETMPQMPQVLAGMGYRGAFFRTHMGYGGDGPSKDADWVNWIGPDGSAIRAVPAYTGREHAWGNEFLVINYKPGIFWYKGPPCTWDDVESFKTEMLGRGVSMPIVSRCEDWYTRPSRPLLDDAKAHASQNTHWVTAEDYFGILERSEKSPVDMRVGPNDFAPRQPWGYAGNRTWTGARAASSQALTAEALSVAAIRLGYRWTPAQQKRVDDAWKALMTAEHHDALICALWNEGRDYTDPSMKLSADLSREMAGYIGGKLNVRGPAVFVFNPTAHARTEAVRLPKAAPLSQVLDPDGRHVPFQREGETLWFLARDVPALGYAAFRLVPGPPTPVGTLPVARGFASDRFEVTLGEHGGLERIRDRVTGRDLLRPGTLTGVLRGVIGSTDEQSAGTARVTLNGPCVWQAREIGTIGTVAYETTYTLPAGAPRIEVHIRLQVPKGTRIGSPADKGTPETRRGGQFFDHGAKLRYVLDTALPAGAAVVRHQPLIIAELPGRKDVVDANLWAGIEQGDTGLAIANRGSMGLRRAGSSLEPLLAYSGEYVWGDRFLEGTYDFDFALIPYGGSAGRADAHRAAVEFDRPLYVLAFDGAGGKAPARDRVVELGACPSAVTAAALFPQDGRVFLRLCDMSPDKAAVAMPTAHRTDLALHLGAAVAGRTELSPWRAETFALSLRR